MEPAPALYDTIGTSYASTRIPDPRIEAQIHAALGNAITVINVGAGAGSYEPTDRRVVAVEPSAVMLAQRHPSAAPAVQAVAEALPFPNRAFDAAMALLTMHHWTDQRGGIEELRRVAARSVMLTFDTDVVPWIVADYLPEIIGQDKFRFPPIAEVARWLDADIQIVPVPHNCTDGFTAAYWARPEAYLEPAARNGTSAMRTLDQALVESRMVRLRDDLASGAWDAKWGHLRDLSELDLGYRLLVSR